jgi:molybdopterin molybdotransferase
MLPWGFARLTILRRKYYVLSLEQAQSAIAEGIVRAEVTEWVALANARGRYLAQSVMAEVDNPAFDNSAMDGYAVNTTQLVAAQFRLPQAGESSAGEAPGTLAEKTTMRIFTGAPIPVGADAVVIQEDIKLDGDHIVFPHTVQPGQNIRARGQDFRKGESLFRPGRRLSAFDIALLSAAGVANVPVYRRARVLVIATGDELVAPGTPLQPGQIYESNRQAALLQVEQAGAEAIDGGTVADNPEAVREVLKNAMDYDFVITSGGVSVGDYDLVKQVFAEIGEINFWKVRIKPGKPVAFGLLGRRTNFFGLPGNPVSSLVTFFLFVRPALASWHHGTSKPLQLKARASTDYHRHAGRTEFLRAQLTSENGELQVTPLPGQGSHMLGTLRSTNALIRLEHDQEAFTAGDMVPVLPLSTEVG